jgi:Streptomyces sporulation and cell division protein, SsgA
VSLSDSKSDVIGAVLKGYCCDSPLGVTLVWHRRNPAAVTALFDTPDDAHWTFARELLDGGGHGDVTVEVKGGWLDLSLRCRTEVIVRLDAACVAAFVARTREIVSDEAITYNDELDRWLADLGGT